MLFSRVASFVACSLALGGAALAKPAMFAKRADLTAVQNVMTNLKSSADTIVPQIQNLASSNNTNANTTSEAVPLVNQLISKFNNASLALHNITSGTTTASTISKRQDDTLQTIASTTASIISEMTTALNSLVQSSSSSSDSSALSGSITTLYTSTSTLLTQLDSTSDGLSGLLGSLLGSVLPLVTSLLGGLLGGDSDDSGDGLGSLLGLVLGLLGL